MRPDPPAWVRDAVFYQIFPDRFRRSGRVPAPGPFEDWDAPPTIHGFKGGDLYGIVDRLDYLAKLGISALYLTPVFASASNHRYHAYDFLTVDPLLGGNEALRELVDAAHARGIRVVLDGVFNHAGRGFWPFHHVLEAGAHSPYRGWFHLDEAALEAGTTLRAYPDEILVAQMAADYAAGAGRSGMVSRARLGYSAWWDLPALPKLNSSHPQMREYLLGVAEHWLRFGIDGWRLDVPEEVDAGFWREFRQRCRLVRPDAYLVGEIWRVRPDWLAGDQFDGLMNYPLGEAILGFAAGSSLDRAAVAEQHEYRDFLKPLDAPGFAARLGELLAAYPAEVSLAQLNLLDSHDTPRALTLCGGDRTALRLAYLLLATLPGAPCVYYGDEIAMEGHHDPDSRRSFPIGEADWDRELLTFMRALFGLRRHAPALRSSAVRVVAAVEGALLLARGREEALVAVNAGDGLVQLGVDIPERPWRAAELPGATWAPPVLRTGAETVLDLPAQSAAIILPA